MRTCANVNTAIVTRKMKSRSNNRKITFAYVRTLAKMLILSGLSANVWCECHHGDCVPTLHWANPARAALARGLPRSGLQNLDRLASGGARPACVREGGRRDPARGRSADLDPADQSLPWLQCSTDRARTCQPETRRSHGVSGGTDQAQRGTRRHRIESTINASPRSTPRPRLSGKHP